MPRMNLRLRLLRKFFYAEYHSYDVKERSQYYLNVNRIFRDLFQIRSNLRDVT